MNADRGEKCMQNIKKKVGKTIESRKLRKEQSLYKGRVKKMESKPAVAEGGQSC